MAFGDSCSKEAMQKYAQSVRPEAAYLPDNVPFVAEINGLEGGTEEVKRIMFEASYMVRLAQSSAMACCKLFSNSTALSIRTVAADQGDHWS